MPTAKYIWFETIQGEIKNCLQKVKVVIFTELIKEQYTTCVGGVFYINNILLHFYIYLQE